MVYKFIGENIGLDEYENNRAYHRYYLLIIHSIVYGSIVYLVLLIFKPFTNNKLSKLSKLSNVSKLS